MPLLSLNAVAICNGTPFMSLLSCTFVWLIFQSQIQIVIQILDILVVLLFALHMTVYLKVGKTCMAVVKVFTKSCIYKSFLEILDEKSYRNNQLII